MGLLCSRRADAGRAPLRLEPGGQLWHFLTSYGPSSARCCPVKGICIQGNRALAEQDFQEVILPPTGLQPFALDAYLQG